jgi:hypothetical protein
MGATEAMREGDADDVAPAFDPMRAGQWRGDHASPLDAAPRCEASLVWLHLKHLLLSRSQFSVDGDQ